MVNSVDGSGWTTDAHTCSCNTLTSVRPMWALPLTGQIKAFVEQKLSGALRLVNYSAFCLVYARMRKLWSIVVVGNYKFQNCTGCILLILICITCQLIGVYLFCSRLMSQVAPIWCKRQNIFDDSNLLKNSF